MSEFYGLEPGGLLPATALSQLNTARREVIAAGRPDVPATTPYTATQLDAMPAGSVYRSTDGPQGAWQWVKQGSGTGPWTVTVGDTGWRDITLEPGASAAYAKARRVNSVVTVDLNSAVPATGGALGLLPFASLWSGSGWVRLPIQLATESVGWLVVRNQSNRGPLHLTGATGPSVTASFPTSSQWPVTL